MAEGRAIEDGDTDKAWKKIRGTKAVPEDFNFQFDSSKVKLYEDIVKISNYNIVASDTKGPDSIKIIDSRHQNVYRMGNIPSSLNIPFTAVLNEDKTFKSIDDLRKVFIEAGIENPES